SSVLRGSSLKGSSIRSSCHKGNLGSSDSLSGNSGFREGSDLRSSSGLRDSGSSKGTC
ncbi:10113_t:CDS:1, partial [Gigaspora margarita]